MTENDSPLASCKALLALLYISLAKADQVGRKDIEVFALLADLAEKGKVERRRGYLWGTDSPAL